MASRIWKMSMSIFPVPIANPFTAVLPVQTIFSGQITEVQKNLSKNDLNTCKKGDLQVL
jgi:hypothetical protein